MTLVRALHAPSGADIGQYQPSQTRATKRPRDHRLDLVRGLALVMIFINHTPGLWLGSWTSRNFGFSDACEIFVLLAGYAAGMSYFPLYAARDYRGVFRKAWHRAGTLYAAHLATTLTAFVLVGCYIAAMGGQAEHDLIGIGQISDSWRVVAVFGGALQLSYFNILPLYVVLLMMLPVMLVLAARDLRLLGAVSIACYLATNVGGVALPACEGCESWFFDPLAWQAMFAIGLALGLSKCRGRVVGYSRVAYGAALAYVGFAAAWTLGSWGWVVGAGYVPDFVGSLHKSHLPVVRLVHVLALSYVVCHSPVWTWLARVPANFALTRMGRHSLPVFAFGAILSVVGWMIVNQPQTGIITQTMFALVGSVVLAGLAKWLDGGPLWSGRATAQVAAPQVAYGMAPG